MGNRIKTLGPTHLGGWWQCVNAWAVVTLVASAHLTETMHSSEGVSSDTYLLLPTLFVFGSSGSCYDCLPALAAAKC